VFNWDNKYNCISYFIAGLKKTTRSPIRETISRTATFRKMFSLKEKKKEDTTGVRKKGV